MLRFLADENLSGGILRGVLRQQPDAAVVRVQDAGLQGADDPTVLEWAAHEGRVLLTHDARTVPRFALERVRAGLPMPGVVIVSQTVPIGNAIEDVLLLVKLGTAADV